MKKKLIVITFAILFSFSVYAMMPTISSAGETIIRIGVIAPTDDQLVTIIPLLEEIIEPDINAYVAKLPSLRFKPDLRFEFLLDCASGNAETHLEKVQNFARMGIDIIIGGFWSGQAAYALPYMNEHNMLLISPASTDPNLAKPNDCLYRLAPNDNNQGPAIAEMIMSQGINNVVVIQRNDPYGNWVFNAFETEYKKKGGNILPKVTYDPNDPNYVACLDTAEEKAKGLDDVGILLISSDEAVGFINEALNYPIIYNLPWFGVDATALNNVILENFE